MTLLDGLKAGTLLFVAAIVQASILSPVTVLRGRPDLLLVTLVAVSLLRGPIFGASAGFFAGLVLDTARLDTLGFTSLLLVLVGYWIGRYGETTGRDRTHAPYLSVAVVTVMYAFASLALHFVLGEHAPARLILLDRLPAEVLFNLLLTLPVYALCRRLFRPPSADRVREVELLA